MSGTGPGVTREGIIALLTRGAPECYCCRERRSWALTIDHVAGGGVQHRRTAGHTSTWRLVWRERRSGVTWPQLRRRYRVACATCNHGARMGGGICPHQAEQVST